jgi:hypothetical protein
VIGSGIAVSPARHREDVVGRRVVGERSIMITEARQLSDGRVNDEDKPKVEDDAQGSGPIPPPLDPGNHAKDDDDD